MHNELDSLVVAHLREIHAQLQNVNTKLEENNRCFDRLDRRLDGFRPIIEHTLELATLNERKISRVRDQHDAAEAWRKRVEQRLDEIEQRLSKVEERFGS